MQIGDSGFTVLTTKDEVAAYKAANSHLSIPDGASVIHQFDPSDLTLRDIRWYDQNGKLIPVETVDKTVDIVAEAHFMDAARGFFYEHLEHRLDCGS